MTNQTTPKKLIEVALPVKEISAESVRDKSIRHGHISTLHLWWARRPLPVCRAVVFASLVPDPLDPHCPAAFGEAVDQLLRIQDDGVDAYRPYEDIPYTAVEDPMEDNRRNRLLMFIGSFSEWFIQNEADGHKTAAKDQLSDYSLIKWDNKNDKKIIRRARKLIWIAHNTARQPEATYDQLAREFDEHERAVKTAEEALYDTLDRHQPSPDTIAQEAALQRAIDAFLDRMPRVFDPFAGGGAIPLEAARLGCRSYGNDLNPVAHIIQRGSLEFPQRYGKPIRFSDEAYRTRYGERALKAQRVQPANVLHQMPGTVYVANRLAHDVAFYARKLLQLAEAEVGHLYPEDKDGNKPIAYYWARVATCANPSCRAEVPLLKQFYLANKSNKKRYLKPAVEGTSINFEIKRGTYNLEGWNNRGNMKCPCCGQITSVQHIKEQSKSGQWKQRLLAVIWEGKDGKEYRLPRKEDIDASERDFNEAEVHRPTESMQRNSAGGDTFSWGVNQWGQMFSPRQLLTMQTLVDKLNLIKKELGVGDETETADEYARAVVTYLGILMDRLAIINTSFGVWHTGRETLERPMGRQAIPMVFDYPESNPFCTSSGSAYNQIDWITRYIESESHNPFWTECRNASSGDVSQFAPKSLDAVVTDPPYYDAIAYADLSDFFYVWLKRTLGDVYPLNFAFPQTPKSEECTALKHHHRGNLAQAYQHFEDKLYQIFSAIEQQTDGVVSIMFAHQSTQAWSTLCNSILRAKMNITGSWANDTEMTGALKTNKAFLESSVTISARPVSKQGFGDYGTIRRAISRTVQQEVKNLIALGFRGADLLTACFGKAVSEFGQYQRVEKANGDEVQVAELLEMAREAAFNALVSDIDTDDVTKFYLGWLELFGFTAASHDDVRRITQIGLNLDVNQLVNERILLRDGNQERLATGEQRLALDERTGLGDHPCAIDQVHRAMHLFDGRSRAELLHYLAQVAASPDSTFWRVLTALVPVLPGKTADHDRATGLLSNRDSLIRAARQAQSSQGVQTEIQLS